MMTNVLINLQYPNKGDTRNYLDIDECECEILKGLIKGKLKRMKLI